ncbi:hypothetical protein [Rhizobium grahamii]|uniref:Uncharacterized protein n=1 Tax=Rhizobium grahamii TaxID=1120045 RepID=A0A370KHS8_9HYPH|nr:hypothetical protein [Rhizobium grahamii]RDJ05068.1 hypothetical protein B5K06_26215 [Rhizobium grahamii]
MFGWLRRMLGIEHFLEENWFNLPQTTEGVADPYIPGFDVVDTGAILAESKTIAGTFFRWHERVSAPPCVSLWQSFLDDDGKWKIQGRFAGPENNCGHFFGLSEPVATSEAIHYDVNFDESEMIEVRASFDRVLDLTTASGRKLAFNAVVENPNFSEAFIAEQIIEEITGGTMLTDRIGHWASHGEYEAILYVGPRMVWGPERKGVEGLRPQKPWDYDLFSMYEQLFRDDRLNLVVFRGRYLLSRISEFRVGKGEWLRNELYGMGEDEIEAELSTFSEYAQFNEEYQEEKRETTWVGKIVYHER